MLQKSNTDTSNLVESNAAFFIKSQSNLNKFFIEKSLYQFGGLD
jgi:hypothetical protein